MTNLRDMVLLAWLGFLALLASPSSALAQQEQEQWTKIDCASASLLPPSGVKADCFEGPLKQVRGQTYACRLSNYSFGFPTDATEPRFFARVAFPKRQGKVCSTTPFADPANAMQHVHKFVENQATNWSGMQAVGSDITVMFFDAKNQKRDGKCFTFIKLGPVAGFSGKGHLFTMLGFFCKAPGKPFDAAAAAATVNAVQVKTE